MRSEAEVNRAIDEYADTVRRICFIHLKDHDDAEDIFQDVFLKYASNKKDFHDSDHEKAWLLRVAINACKDLKKSFYKQKTSFFEDILYEPFGFDNNDTDLMDCVLRLPENYRRVIYLYYYEGYSAVEISNILDKKENTIYTWLSRAKQSLKIELGGDFFE